MIILILGGVRSGKSSYAIELAKNFNNKTAFIAVDYNIKIPEEDSLPLSKIKSFILDLELDKLAAFLRENINMRLLYKILYQNA